VRSEIGEAALQRANRAAGFDAELIEGRGSLVAQQAVADFVATISREAGEPQLGLLMAPAMNVADYGSFGRYVFSADTLGHAIRRSIAALRYHSPFDRMSITTAGDEARYSYVWASPAGEAHAAIASATAGELLSLFRAYLPDDWHPLRIELDIAVPHQPSLFEDTFQCPVYFNAPAVAIVFERRHLKAVSRAAFRPILTIEDVARDWPNGAPRSLLAVTVQQIRKQVDTGSVNIDGIARSMNTSVRTLQRELGNAGTDFRSITSAVRIQRATELLRETSESVTRISTELGYSSPAGFARAFRKVTGVGPQQYRTSHLARW